MEDASQLAIEARVAEEQRHHSITPFFYQNMEPRRMLTILMGLSLVKATLIIGYFMHMKYEISRMKRLTMCALVFCLAMMMVFFPDAFRILSLGTR
jgi:caa(3)-type oxidase subunit IV